MKELYQQWIRRCCDSCCNERQGGVWVAWVILPVLAGFSYLWFAGRREQLGYFLGPLQLNTFLDSHVSWKDFSTLS